MSDYKTFTSQDLMKAMGLQVGDKLKFIDVSFDNHIYQLVLENNEYLIRTDLNETLPLNKLINRGFKILPKPKKVGENICNGNCPTCPCIFVCNEEVNAVNKTLYEVLDEGIKTFVNLNVSLKSKVYNAIKENLDKEVKEHESNTN